MNRDNLSKLAIYLDTIPADYRQFYMGDFLAGRHTNEELTRYQTDPTYNLCGSAACAVGHGPAAGIKVDPSTLVADFDSTSDVWTAYCRAAFGVTMDTPEFEFMFGGGWSSYDNTPAGAAARIRYVLDGKPIPQVKEYYSPDKMVPFDSYEMCYADPLTQIVPLYAEYLK